MSKRTRQQAVIDIISRQRIPSQAALASELKKLNFEVTQATLSRDIAELNLVKSKDGYLRPEDAGGVGMSPIPDAKEALRRLVVKVEVVQNLIIVRTPRSSAQQVGIVFDDKAFFDKVVGTVAGDDTLLVITRNVDDAADVEKIVLSMID